MRSRLGLEVDEYHSRTDRSTESETLGGNRGMPVRPPMLLAIVAKLQSDRFSFRRKVVPT